MAKRAKASKYLVVSDRVAGVEIGVTLVVPDELRPLMADLDALVASGHLRAVDGSPSKGDKGDKGDDGGGG